MGNSTKCPNVQYYILSIHIFSAEIKMKEKQNTGTDNKNTNRRRNAPSTDDGYIRTMDLSSNS